MLSGVQSMELCRILRSDPKTKMIPIIMPAAKGEEVDVVLGFELGDRRLRPGELLARIKTS